MVAVSTSPTQRTTGGQAPLQGVLWSVILSVILTLFLWFIQSIFGLNMFWTFVVYILLLLALFYWVVPALNRSQLKM
jgi:Flp pilus assembly protein TadB